MCQSELSVNGVGTIVVDVELTVKVSDSWSGNFESNLREALTLKFGVSIRKTNTPRNDYQLRLSFD